MKMRFLILILLLFCGKAFACSCIGESSVQQSWKNTNTVFSGTVIRMDTLRFQPDSVFNPHFTIQKLKVYFKTENNYKHSRIQDTVVVFTGMGGGDCGYYFQMHGRYIVYADKLNGKLETIICTRTCNFNQAEDAALKTCYSPKAKNQFPDKSDSLTKSITVHFYYGSKPARGYKDTESHYFGGIHGGHVSLQIDSTVFSFVPAGMPVHIFAHRNKRQSTYISDQANSFLNDTDGCKFTSITFPISDSQYVLIQNLKTLYLDSTPYDYAFFGMRCAAAAYDVLGQAGVVKKRNHFTNVCRNFYPKRMRKRLIRRAKREHLQMVQHDGRKSRRWETD